MTLYVNSEKIDDAAITAEAEKLRPQYEQVFTEMSPDERETQLMDWSRENVIEGVLIRQAAQNDPEDLPAEVIDQAFQQIIDQAGGKEQFFQQAGLNQDKEGEIKNDLAQRLRVERLISNLTREADEPTEKEITKYYEQNTERFTIPEMIHAAHIVKHIKPIDDPDKVEQEMQAIRSQIGDKTQFEDLASKHSECPENGGDLGFFARGQMVQQFEDIVFNMEIGTISPVFQTEFGFHIAKVLEKKPSIPCPLDEVREVIVKELTEQAQQKAIEKFVDTQKEKANIEEK